MKEIKAKSYVENKYGVKLKSYGDVHEVIKVMDKLKFHNLIVLLIENEEGYKNSYDNKLDCGYEKNEAIVSMAQLYHNAVVSNITHYVIDIYKPYITVKMRKDKLKCIISKMK